MKLLMEHGFSPPASPEPPDRDEEHVVTEGSPVGTTDSHHILSRHSHIGQMSLHTANESSLLPPGSFNTQSATQETPLEIPPADANHVVDGAHVEANEGLVFPTLQQDPWLLPTSPDEMHGEPEFQDQFHRLPVMNMVQFGMDSSIWLQDFNPERVQ